MLGPAEPRLLTTTQLCCFATTAQSCMGTWVQPVNLFLSEGRQTTTVCPLCPVLASAFAGGGVALGAAGQPPGQPAPPPLDRPAAGSGARERQLGWILPPRALYWLPALLRSRPCSCLWPRQPGASSSSSNSSSSSRSSRHSRDADGGGGDSALKQHCSGRRCWGWFHRLWCCHREHGRARRDGGR